MEKIRVRCRSCGKEIEGRSNKTYSCGCPNMMTVYMDKISAVDLGQVVMLNSINNNKKSNVLSTEDIAWQEARRKRKVRKLDFEVK